MQPVLELNLYELHHKQGHLVIAVDSALDLIFRQERDYMVKHGKSLVRSHVLTDALFASISMYKIEVLNTASHVLALELDCLGAFVSAVVQCLLKQNSGEMFRLSILPHRDISEAASAGNYWGAIQALRRTARSAGRVACVCIYDAAIVPKEQTFTDNLVSYYQQQPQFALGLSTSEFDTLFAGMDPQIYDSAPHPTHMQQNQPFVSYNDSPAHEINTSVPTTAHLLHASFLGSVPVPTLDYSPNDEITDVQSLYDVQTPSYPFNPIQSILTNSQQSTPAPIPVGDLSNKRPTAAPESAALVAPYAPRHIPPLQSLSAAASEKTSPVSSPLNSYSTSSSSSQDHSFGGRDSPNAPHVAPSKATVHHATQVSTAWHEGNPYVPLYIATAYVIGGGATPTDSRRWLNRAAPQYQPSDEDPLPSKVAGTLPRVRYVKWSYLERLVDSSGLESCVPKDRSHSLVEKFARFERLRQRVFSSVSAISS